MTQGFIISMGGSGTKVVECLLHMLAIGGDRQQWPDEMHILVVETDGANGNLGRLKDLAKYYQQVQETLCLNGFFQTKIFLYHWQPVVPGNGNDNRLANYTGGDPNAKLLCDLLFSEDEVNHTIDVGFQGHPALGVVFLTKLLHEASSAAGTGRREPNALGAIRDFQRAAKDAKRILVIGSCFGGTGATGIPIMKDYLRETCHYEGDLGLLMLLPTFALPKKDKGSDMNIHSETFNEKVKTVLSFYEDGKLLSESPHTAYDTVCLLGYPKLVAFDKYAPGKENQDNPSTIFDWIGCLAINQYFRSEAPLRLGNGLYLCFLKDQPWDFSRLSQVIPTVEADVTMMLQAACLYLGILDTGLRDLTNGRLNVRHASTRAILDRHFYLREFFPQWDSGSAEAVRGVATSFSRYCQFFVEWLFQILIHIPSDFPKDQDVHALADFHGCSEKALERYFVFKEREHLHSMMSQQYVRANRFMRLKKEDWDRLVPTRLHPANPSQEQIFNAAKAVEEALHRKRQIPLDQITQKSAHPPIDEYGALGRLWTLCDQKAAMDSGAKSTVALLQSLLRTVSAYHSMA